MADAYEVQGGRELQIRNGGITALRVFHVTDTSDESGVLNYFGKGDVPDYGDQHPSVPNLFARENTTKLVQGHNDLWELTWSYAPFRILGMPNTPGSPETPETPGFLRYAANASGQFELAWRRDANPSVVGISAGSDIGGTGIDAMGNPTSVMRPQLNFTVSVTERYDEVEWPTIRSTVGTRNDDNFLGLEQYMVLYLGCNAQRMSSDTVSITHNFLHDKMFHLKQVPWRNDLGNIEPGTLPGPIPIVNHIQPFPDTSNFGALSRHF